MVEDNLEAWALRVLSESMKFQTNPKSFLSRHQSQVCIVHSNNMFDLRVLYYLRTNAMVSVTLILKHDLETSV